jgi:hypothetical protein
MSTAPAPSVPPFTARAGAPVSTGRMRFAWPHERIHIVLSVGSYARSLCGLDIEEDDLFPADSGADFWREVVDARCPECATRERG